jgi:type VI protein secretion system component VasK
MFLDCTMILLMAMRHPIVSALAILSFGSILLFVADIIGSITAWLRRRMPQLSRCWRSHDCLEQLQQQPDALRQNHHHHRPTVLVATVLPLVARLTMVLAAAVMVVAALVLAVAVSSRYYYWWTTLVIEAVGWASLAYFSYEAGVPKPERQGDDQSTAEDAGSSDDSQATVSAEAEDAFQDVLVELKGRFCSALIACGE